MAAVDSANQIIVAAEVIGSGSEQAMLLPMIGRAAVVATPHTLVTADAGYHSDANIQALHERGIPAMNADNGMSRFTLRGQAKVSTRWQLYCLVHNIEKLARAR
jgi:hypothetical protein